MVAEDASTFEIKNELASSWLPGAKPTSLAIVSTINDNRYFPENGGQYPYVGRYWASLWAHTK